MDKNIICYEADIRFSYRFMIDKNIRACMDIKGESEKDESFKVDKVLN